MYGIDAVLLADFAAPLIHKKDSVIDLGSGNGIIPLLLSSLCPKAQITGLEIQVESAKFAKESILLNHLEERLSFVNADLKNVASLFNRHSFNVVCSNPPYMTASQGKLNPNDAKALARHEISCTLEDVIFAAEYLLATHGKFFMIHRPSRLPEILSLLLKYKMEPKRLCLVHPSSKKNANLVLVEARKNAAPELILEPPLFVYEEKSKACGAKDETVKDEFTKDEPAIDYSTKEVSPKAPYSPQMEAIFERLRKSSFSLEATLE